MWNSVKKHGIHIAALGLVEVVSVVNMSTYGGYHERHMESAYLLALAFSILLAGSVIMVAHPHFPSTVRFLLSAGVTTLFLTQAVANISVAYIAGSTSLPVDVLERLWGKGWLPVSSLIFGGVINVVGLTYWLALGVYMRSQIQDQEALSRLQEFVAQMQAQQPQSEQADEFGDLFANAGSNGRKGE
jgi:hypothetical protein